MTSKEATVFIHNLNLMVNENDIKSLFKQAGNIVDVQLIKDSKNNSKGYGFVTFETAKDAQTSIKKFDKFCFKGRKIIVELVIKEENHEGENKKRKIPISEETFDIINTLKDQIDSLKKQISEINALVSNTKSKKKPKFNSTANDQIINNTISNKCELQTKTTIFQSQTGGEFWINSGYKAFFNNYNENNFYLFHSITIKQGNSYCSCPFNFSIRYNLSNPPSIKYSHGKDMDIFQLFLSLYGPESYKNFIFIDVTKKHKSVFDKVMCSFNEDLYDAMKNKNMLTDYMSFGFKVQSAHCIAFEICYWEYKS